MFSKACEYAIRSTLYIAEQSKSEKRVGLKEIAVEIASPEAFTAKILQKLVKNKIINSVKGPSGGFEVNLQHLNTITLGHIVFAIDGTELVTQCGLGLKACNEAKPCPVHHKFKIVRNQLQQMLETTSLNEMVTGMKNGNVYLKL